VLIIGALVAVVLWVFFARWRFLVDAGLERLEVKTKDGWTLPMRHLPSPHRRFKEPVVLCPGLANNHRMFDVARPKSLLRALSEAGFDCYLVDLRGGAGTRRAPGARHDASVDDHVHYDVPALVEAACARAGASQAFWLGHSLGGLVAAAAAQHGGLPLKGLIAVGSPFRFQHGAATRALLRAGMGLTRMGRLRADWAMLPFAPLAGWVALKAADGMVNQKNVAARIQRRAMASVFSPIWGSVLAQLHDWEAHDAFRSREGVDWRGGLSKVETPVLLVAGTVDLLADATSTAAALELVGAKDKSLLVFGRAHGHLEDYGHGDLLIGNSAATEVFPKVIQWLEARASPS
jgi:pimeloyl-ACP methyl ester carboxylesterase